MYKAVSFFIVAAGIACCALAVAADRVVVVPLGSGAKGTDGQVQYNDNGTTAGAELYYDKSSRRLEARGEVRTTDGAGNPRLWGKGRPGTDLMTHSQACPNLLATTRFALSTHVASWEGAAEACPVDTWVCTDAELPTTGSCNIVSGSYIYQMTCVGTPSTGTVSSLLGWVADASFNPGFGVVVESDNMARSNSWPVCTGYHVWCCWKSSLLFPPIP